MGGRRGGRHLSRGGGGGGGAALAGMARGPGASQGMRRPLREPQRDCRWTGGLELAVKAPRIVLTYLVLQVLLPRVIVRKFGLLRGRGGGGVR